MVTANHRSLEILENAGLYMAWNSAPPKAYSILLGAIARVFDDMSEEEAESAVEEHFVTSGLQVLV